MKGRLALTNYYLLVACILATTVFGCAGGKKKTGKTTRIPITIYKSAAIDIRSRNIEKIAVAPFSDSNSEISTAGMKTAESLARALSDTLIYTVKSPSEVNSDLLVNGFGIKPFMERAELKKIGQSLKVDAFFLGELKKREIVDKVFSKVITEKEETGEGEFVTDPEGKLLYQPKTKDVEVDMECKTGIGEVVIRFKLYDAQTGDLIFDRVETLSEEVDAFCYRSGLNPEKMSASEIGQLLEEVTIELCEGFVQQLTPPSKTELVIFERVPGADKISTYLVELGIDYAKVGDWPKAIDSFSKCRDKNTNSSEAHYDLGLAYEGYGWAQKALNEYMLAKKLTPKKLYTDAIRNVRRIIKMSRENTE